MTAELPYAEIIAGPVSRKTSNRLRMVFNSGPGDPIATATQSGADGRGAGVGILFGFRNGGAGNHVLEFADGHQLVVGSRDSKPTEITRDGEPFATVQRGAPSVASDANGKELVRFTSDPQDAKTPDLFRINLTLPDGRPLGDLDVIRRGPGWTAMRTLDELTGTFYWWDHAGAALKIPILGTRLMLTERVEPVVSEVLLAACVDIAIGLRPYIPEMS
ncbi:hypothetical protein [uncultured Jatrophihabitans sp.]|uniref:hypothetical protein n=1 Tax=uncultured Jatrophihabitans sp. TaxID=1610747 RepID=UPI0035C9D751